MLTVSARRLSKTTRRILYRLVLEFGDSILTPRKALNRRELGRLAFARLHRVNRSSE